MSKKISILIITIAVLLIAVFIICFVTNNSNKDKSIDKVLDISSSSEDKNNDIKILIAYFSRTGENYSVGVINKGNTEIVAEYISEITGGDLFEIKPLIEYSKDYKTCCDEAKKEYTNDTRPELKEYLDSLDNYGTIYLGYPIWFGTMPMEVYTFLSHYDFNEKVIIPFSTHEGSGFGNSVNDIKRIVPNAIIKDGFAIRGKEAKNSKSKVVEWFNKRKGEIINE